MDKPCHVLYFKLHLLQKIPRAKEINYIIILLSTFQTKVVFFKRKVLFTYFITFPYAEHLSRMLGDNQKIITTLELLPLHEQELLPSLSLDVILPSDVKHKSLTHTLFCITILKII